MGKTMKNPFWTGVSISYGARAANPGPIILHSTSKQSSTTGSIGFDPPVTAFSSQKLLSSKSKVFEGISRVRLSQHGLEHLPNFSGV